jgi:hypothetical protein
MDEFPARPAPASRTAQLDFISDNTFLISCELAAGNCAVMSANVKGSTCLSTLVA